MRYDKVEEKEYLDKTNEELIKYMREYPKDKISLSAIGNSISNGFSLSEPGRLLLDRNLGLIEYGKNNGVKVQTYHLTRSENNNALAVSNWIMNNCCEKNTYKWNKEDYKRYIKENNTLLTEEEINKYFEGGSEIPIQDILFNKDGSANIVILNLGTGSFLDIVTRHGSLTIPNIDFSLTRDISGISSILEFINNNNRKNNTDVQIYLCGAPRIINTHLTSIFMNNSIKKLGNNFANVVYVPSFPRQPFYIAKNGGIIADPHYNEAEYYHFLAEIENKIIDSYLATDILIDLDRLLFQMGNDNDVNGAKYSKNDAMDIIDIMAKKYENKTGDYNFFIEFIKPYIKSRYPYDFYRLSQDKNLSKELDSLKIHK